MATETIGALPSQPHIMLTWCRHAYLNFATSFPGIFTKQATQYLNLHSDNRIRWYCLSFGEQGAMIIASAFI